MARVIAGMTLSLDGFVADSSGSLELLYPDLAGLQGGDYMNSLIDETGAVIMGRRTFDMADDPDWYAGNYEFQVPIFVLTHSPPNSQPKEDENISFTFLDDLQEAVPLALAAAGERDVTVVGGVNVIRQLLQAGLVDELSIDIMPVLLGEGLPFFDREAAGIRLETVGVKAVGERTCLRFRVVK